MSVMRRSHLPVLGLILIDLPVLLAVAVVGWFYGYQHTYWTIADWRLEHQWTLLPSLILTVVLILKVARRPFSSNYRPSRLTGSLRPPLRRQRTAVTPHRPTAAASSSPNHAAAVRQEQSR